MNLWKKPRYTYLDSAAATPPTQGALRAFSEGMEVYGNPASVHAEGVAAKAVLEQARSVIAKLAEVKADAVVFTSGATEANALVIQGVPHELKRTGTRYEDMHVLYDAGAHASLVHAIETLAELGVRIEALAYKGAGIDMEAFEKQITDTTVLIAVSAVCGETGSVTDTREMRRVLDRVHTNASTKAVLHVDASQLPRYGAFELTRLGADTLALDAQKVGGVRGVGALIVPHRVHLAPLMQGGGQERGLRPGTPSVALARSFAAALTEAHDRRDTFVATSGALRALLLESIRELPGVEVNEGTQNAPHILNISLRGRDTDYLVALLNEAGFAVSTRSACETDATGSRAVLNMTNDRERASSTLRISFDYCTTEAEIRAFASALIRSVKFLDTAGIL